MPSLVIALTLVAFAPLVQSTDLAECNPSRLSAIDYALGSWHAHTHEPSSGILDRQGTAVVTTVAAGCALEIRLKRESGYEEVRLISLDERRGTWQMSVIDSHHGNLVVMNGHEVENGMDFISTHHRRDRLLFDRVSIRPSKNGWAIRTETSAGYGAQWQLVAEVSFFRGVQPHEKSALDQTYPGWILQPNYGAFLVRGDFDGNGNEDLGAHISYPDSATEPSQVIVVVFNYSDSSEVYPVEPADELYSLGVLTKGSMECEVHTDNCWAMEADVLAVGYEEKAGWIYIWDDGSFEMVVTGD